MADIVHRVRTIYGRVQGVGYRAHVVWTASRYPIAGSVRNLPDGAVQVEAQGPREVVLEFFEEIMRPSWPIHPQGFRNEEELPPDPALSGFEVRHGSL